MASRAPESDARTCTARQRWVRSVAPPLTEPVGCGAEPSCFLSIVMGIHLACARQQGRAVKECERQALAGRQCCIESRWSVGGVPVTPAARPHVSKRNDRRVWHSPTTSTLVSLYPARLSMQAPVTLPRRTASPLHLSTRLPPATPPPMPSTPTTRPSQLAAAPSRSSHPKTG